MRYFILCLSVVSTLISWSQATEKYESPLAGFYRAEDLFEKEQYSAARREFRLFVNEYRGSANDPFYIKALYYEGISALEVYNNDAVPLLEQFNRDYPESIYRYDIYFRIGRYYYQKKDYKKTIEWFAQLNRQRVEPENADEYFFKLGYSYFEEEQFADAKIAFYEVKDATSQYGAPALYYYSHISYEDGSYQQALEGFEKLLQDPRFGSVVPYYITQIYHKQGKYQEIADFAPPLIDSLKPEQQVEMNHLVGDAFYKLNKFDEAVPYLEAYNLHANTTRDDDYELGYAYFKSSNYEKAIKYFDKVARTKDTLGQIALYHAAESYLNLNQLSYARKAFQAASNLDMDLMIQEDALYNYAILSYKLDLNPYDEAVVALEEYLYRYPQSPRKNVVYQYLVNVYTSTKNYAKALESLDKLPNKDIKLKTAYQVIAFNRGVELYQKGDFEGAVKAFALVEKYPISQEISAKAVFWTGDAYYKVDNLRAAIENYRKFLAMPLASQTGLKADAYYNIGYSYWDMKDVPQYMESFRTYLQQPNLANKHKRADAYMRLGDGQYLSKDNRAAISSYESALALKAGYEDQALYYLARLYGIEDNRDKKISLLLDIVNNYPRSQYVQSSIYEVATSYFAAGNFDKSLRYFEQVVRDYPTSILVKDALHYIGNAYYKKNDYAKAESYYRRVLSEYGNDRATCKREVDGLADIYTAQRQLEKIELLANEFPCADSIRFEVEDRFYEQAMKPYNDSSFAASIPEFDKYLSKYPNGKYLSEILYYKADALYRLKRESDAVAVYRQLLEGADDEFTEIAAQRSAKFLFNSKQYEPALQYYERLEKVAKYPENIYTSRLGLMRTNFLLENFANAADYAQKVLQNTKLTNTIRLEAEYVRGISLSSTGSFTAALPSLEYVVKNSTTVSAAEAKYTIAAGWFKENNLEKTDAEIRSLLKMKPSYNYWTAKALILQTRVLMLKNDLFQAEQTILSVIEFYETDDDGILEEASILYDEVMQAKNEPKSVVEPKNTIIEVEENAGKP
jgi:tetratricopeptide (TPR) repeat protein